MAAGAGVIRVYSGLDEARAQILGKRVAEAFDLPTSVQERIRSVFGADLTAREVVERILADVRASGDDALRTYTRAVDGVEVDDLEISDAELDAAVGDLEPGLRTALEAAAARVRAFHERARRSSWLDFSATGALGQMIVPLDSVGIYAPGGRATYPSTV